MTAMTKTLYEEKEIQKYWDLSLPAELQENETVRVVSQVKEADGTYGKYGILTIKNQIRSTKDLIAFFNALQKQNPNKVVGISISTTVFEFTGAPPTAENFRFTNTISIDIDTHIGSTKERYVLGYLEDSQIEMSLIKTWLEINKQFQKQGLDITMPLACTLTGGGLQMILGFERSLNKIEAQRLFGLIKGALKDLKWRTVLKDALGNYTPVEHDIDSSFADIIHVQRCAGSLNQKYGIMSRFIDIFGKNREQLHQLKDVLITDMLETGYTGQQKETYRIDVTEAITTFINDRDCARLKFEVESNLVTAKMQSSRVTVRSSDLKNIEYELLQKIKKTGITTLELLKDDVKIGQSTGNLSKLFCPFHEETNPSMAFYENEIFDVFKDFHDDKTYNLITFWEKLYGVSKSTAITQLAEKAGVPLAKSERKDFQNLELDEIIDELIKRINTEDFIYYRLASKSRNCIVRHIDTGESFTFDGPKMLANHILLNQLNILDAEKALSEEFAIRFQEKVLIDAFEEFFPGKDAIFSKEFIKFVNLWVPNKNYRLVQEAIIEMDYMLIEDSIAIIKKRTPWVYKFLLQIIQNGDIVWFVNWLASTAKFKTMPVVPVIYGCPGAGKNLFITSVMEFFFGPEYTKVVTGDKVGQQFNSILETASLLVLDESDFASSKEFDSLKFMTGNETLMIEKKGVDVVARKRHFNVMLFSNGDVPLRHQASDRRITYHHNEINLVASCNVWKIKDIDEFLEKIKDELIDFWSIICRTEIDSKLAMTNVKDGGFWRQIMKMHPAGALIMKLMDKEWNDIALQLNENVTDDTEMKINLELLETIKDQFESNGNLSLSLINRYLQSLNFKMKTSVQRFIADNHLSEFGISVVVTDTDVILKVNKKKVRASIKTKNILKVAYPSVSKIMVSDLDAELEMDKADITYQVEEIATAVIANLEQPPAPDLP